MKSSGQPPLFSHRYLKVMAESGDVEGLLEALDEKRVQDSRHMRRVVVNELGAVGDPLAVGPVSEVLSNDTDPSTRGLAAKALGRIGDPAALPALRQALERDSDAASKMWAIQNLGRLKDRESIDLLLKSLQDQSTGVRSSRREHWERSEINVHFGGLVEALRDRRSGVKLAAAEGLVGLGDSRALEPLKEAHDRSALLTRLRLRRPLNELEERFG